MTAEKFADGPPAQAYAIRESRRLVDVAREDVGAAKAASTARPLRVVARYAATQYGEFWLCVPLTYMRHSGLAFRVAFISLVAVPVLATTTTTPAAGTDPPTSTNQVPPPSPQPVPAGFALPAAPVVTTGLVYSEIYVSSRSAAIPVIFFTEDRVLVVATSKTQVPEARDVAGERKESVTIVFDRLSEIRRTTTRVEWSSVAHVSGLAPASSIKRSGTLTIGDVSTSFPYSVANERGFKWVLDPPSQAAVLPANHQLPFNITTAEDDGTDLRICNVSLSANDSSSRQLPADALTLAVPGKCDLSIPQGLPTRVVLNIDPARVPYGTYKGSVTLALSPSAETKRFDLTVIRSSAGIKFVGFLALLGGIAVSMIAVNSRLVIARAEAMLPFSHMLWLVKDTANELTNCTAAGGGNAPAAPNTAEALLDLEGMLSESSLDVNNLLPTLWPSTAAPPSAATYLQNISDRLTRLKLLIAVGLCPLYRMRLTIPEADREDIDRVLIKHVDPIAAALPATLSAVQQAIDDALGQLSDQKLVAESISRAGEGLPTPAPLFYRAHTAGSRLWVIWIAVTAVTGAIVTILMIPGFGIPLDHLKCFLWGFGVNTVGTQLQQLTPGSVGSVVGISLPKSP